MSSSHNSKLITPDGTEIHGVYVNHRFSVEGVYYKGKCTLILPNRCTFKGTHDDWGFTGRGTMVNPDGRVEHSGMFKCGARHGEGMHIRSDGLKYVGGLPSTHTPVLEG